MKQCVICGQWKEETEFYLRSDTGKLRNSCKFCQNNRLLTEQQRQRKNSYNNERYANNKDKINALSRAHRQENRQEILAKEREYNKQNRDKILARKLEYNKRYYEQNKEKILAKRKFSYYNTKYGIDRKLLNAFSKYFNNPNKIIEKDLDYYGLNYTFADVKIKFDTLLSNIGLNYSDYGSKWELDHILPRNLFNYNSTNDTEFQICWSLLNLRPILKEVNKSRPKDGSDVSEALKQQILNNV